jgi:AcrR family transcriptional regulator
MPQGSGSERRNKERSKRRFIEASVELVRENGFKSLGVNAVAERAELSKVLIYRYFGGLSGLLSAVADEIDPLQSDAAEQLLQSIDSAATAGEIVERVVMDLHRALDQDELTKQLLVTELNEHNELTETLAAAREELGLELTRRLSDELRARNMPSDLDFNALVAVIYSGVMYLTLRSSTAPVYNGVDIRSDAGWQRMASTLRALVDHAAPPRAGSPLGPPAGPPSSP